MVLIEIDLIRLPMLLPHPLPFGFDGLLNFILLLFQ